MDIVEVEKPERKNKNKEESQAPLLSTNKQPFSQVKINGKYYLQAKNKLEQEIMDPPTEGDDQVFDYPFHINLVENKNGSVKIVSLSELIKLIKYFDVTEKVAKNAIRSLIGLKTIKMKSFLPKPHQINKISELIQIYSSHEISKAFFEGFGNNQETIETLQKEYQIFAKSFHHSIFKMQFLPYDSEEVEMHLFNGKRELISEQNKKDFLIWKKFLEVQGTRDINVFLPKFDLKDEYYTQGYQLQKFLDFCTNKYPSQIDQVRLKQYGSAIQLELEQFHFLDKQVKKPEKEQIFVEMRNINGKFRLATMDSNINHIEYLFKEISTHNNLTYQKINEYREIITLQRPLLCFYIDIKDLAQNVHYDIVQHYLGLHYLGEYLKKRQVIHINKETQEETKLNVTKGIFIGEVFTPIIVNIICGVIKNSIEISFKNALKKLGFAFSDLYVYKFQDDYFIKVFDKEHQFYSTKQVVDYLKLFEDTKYSETILDVVKNDLQQLGFEINEQKVRVLLQRQKQRKIWSLNSHHKLVPCDNFIVLKQDMLDPLSQKKDLKQHATFLFDLVNKYPQNEELLTQYSELELFVIYKIIAKYIREYKDLPYEYKSVLVKLEQEIKKKLNIKRKQIIATDY